MSPLRVWKRSISPLCDHTACLVVRIDVARFSNGVDAVSGKVRVAWHKLTGQRVAVKTYEKAKIKVRRRFYCVSLS